MKLTRLAASIAACVVAILAIGASTAVAVDAMGVHPGGAIRLTSLGRVTFRNGEVSVACNVTLNGSLLESINFTRGEPVGRVSSFSSGSCSGGTVERVLGLSWSVTYEAFLGTLPNVTGELWSIQRFSIKLDVLGVRCLYEGTLGALLPLTGSFPATAGLLRTLSSMLSLVEGMLCPASITASGSFTLSPEQQFITFQQTPLSANPGFVVKADAQVSATVVITATQAVTIRETRLERGTAGWSLDAMSAAACNRSMMVGQGCGPIVRAEGGARRDNLLFINNAGATVKTVPLLE